MRFLSYDSVLARGEIAARASLLYARLEGTMYRPDTIFTVETAGWPGDWEGRTILALTILAQSTGKEPAYLDEIVEQLDAHCNEKGYMRQILQDGDVDEQQLSGHGWLLRGLCEYFLYRREDPVRSEQMLHRIRAIVQNLFLNAAGRYAEYPILPEERVEGGKESGHIGRKVGHWYISSDTGCAYIPLDGLSQAYVLLREYAIEEELIEQLKALLDEMVMHFYAIPFLEIKVQTHATLTACRGLLRLYEYDRDPKKLAFVQKIFKLYIDEGMTANYANYNWFGRPEWTEPCAVIDSFMLAAQLYRHTHKQMYLELVHKILYNGVFSSQRSNGGFGTDTCTGAESITDAEFLACSCYEAYWCCSMRGGEGLASVNRYSLLEWTPEEVQQTNGFPNTVEVLYPMDGIYTVHGVKLMVRTDYPMSGKITFRILENPGNKPLTLAFPGMQHIQEPGQCLISFCSGEVVRDVKVDLHLEDTAGNNNGTGKILYAGYQILGCAEENRKTGIPDVNSLEQSGKNWTAPDGTVYIPISERYLDTPEGIQHKKMQIIWQ